MTVHTQEWHDFPEQEDRLLTGSLTSDDYFKLGGSPPPMSPYMFEMSVSAPCWMHRGLMAPVDDSGSVYLPQGLPFRGELNTQARGLWLRPVAVGGTPTYGMRVWLRYEPLPLITTSFMLPASSWGRGGLITDNVEWTTDLVDTPPVLWGVTDVGVVTKVSIRATDFGANRESGDVILHEMGASGIFGNALDLGPGNLQLSITVGSTKVTWADDVTGAVGAEGVFFRADNTVEQAAMALLAETMYADNMAVEGVLTFTIRV